MSGPESNWSAWLGKAENDLLNMENNLAAARLEIIQAPGLERSRACENATRESQDGPKAA